MANTKVYTYHGSQSAPVNDLRNDDLLVIAQDDPSTPSKYRTVDITSEELYQFVFGEIKNKPNLVAIGTGMLGKGTVEDPLRVDTDFIERMWVNRKMINIAQVGKDPHKRWGSVSGNVFKSPETFCFLAGISKVMPAQDHPIRSTEDQEHRLYLTVKNNDLVWIWSTAYLPERYDLTYVATAHTNENGGLSFVDGVQFIRLGNYRIGELDPQIARYGRGSTIPVSEGIVYEIGYTVNGSLVGESFKMINGRSRLIAETGANAVWTGRTDSKIRFLGGVWSVLQAQANAENEYAKVLANLFLRSPGGVATPAKILVTIQKDSGLIKTCTLKKISELNGLVEYRGDLPADEVLWDEAVKDSVTMTDQRVSFTQKT